MAAPRGAQARHTAHASPACAASAPKASPHAQCAAGERVARGARFRAARRSTAAAAALALALLCACVRRGAGELLPYSPQWVGTTASSADNGGDPGSGGGGVVFSLAHTPSAPGPPANTAATPALYLGGAWFGATQLSRGSGTAVSLADATAGGADALLARVSPSNGTLLWSTSGGNAGDDWVTGVATGAPVSANAGALVACGVTAGGAGFSFSGASSGASVSASMSVADGQLVRTSAPTPAGFVVALAAGTGGALWARRIGGGGGDTPFTTAPQGSPWTLVPSGVKPFSAGSTPAFYGGDGAFGVAVDASGDVLLAAQVGPATTALTDDTLNTGLSTLPFLRTGADAFLVKLNTDGRLVWHLRAAGASGEVQHEGAFGVAASLSDASAVVVGATTSDALAFELTSMVNLANDNTAVTTTSFGSLTTYASSRTSAFIFKATSAGSLSWAVAAVGGFMGQGGADVAIYGAAAYGVAVDGSAAGAVLACGTFTANLRFVAMGANAVLSTTIAAAASPDGGHAGWLAKLSSAGTLLWAAALGGSSDGDTVARVALDSAGDVYAFGTMVSQTATFGGAFNAVKNAWSGGIVVARDVGSSDAMGYVAKFKGSTGSVGGGTPLWAALAFSPGVARVTAGAVANASTGQVFWGGVMTMSPLQSRTGLSARIADTNCNVGAQLSLQSSAAAAAFLGAVAQQACVDGGVGGGSSSTPPPSGVVIGTDASPPPKADTSPPPKSAFSPPPAIALLLPPSPPSPAPSPPPAPAIVPYPWVAGSAWPDGARLAGGAALPLSLRAVATTPLGNTVFTGGWVLPSAAPSWGITAASGVSGGAAAALATSPGGASRDAIVIAAAAATGSGVFNVSFGGASDDFVTDIAVATAGNTGAAATLLVAGRFGGGTVALPSLAGETTFTLSSFSSANETQPTPAGFLLLMSPTLGYVKRARAIGASGGGGTLVAAGDASLGLAQFASDDFARNGAYGVSASADGSGAVYVAAAVGTDTFLFCDDTSNVASSGVILSGTASQLAAESPGGAHNLDAYVALFDGSLTLTWTLQLAGAGHEGAYGVSSFSNAAAGGVGVAAVGTSTSPVLSIALASASARMPPLATLTRLFTQSYGWVMVASASGSLSWAVSLAAQGGSAAATSVATDAAASVLVAGTFIGKLWVVPSWVTGTTGLSSPGSLTSATSSGFVAKLSAQGTQAWLVPVGGDADSSTSRVATDDLGDAYAFGAFSGTPLGAQLAGDAAPVFGGGASDGYVAKLSGGGSVSKSGGAALAGGTLMWLAPIAGGGNEGALGGAVRGNTLYGGDVFVAGVVASQSTFDVTFPTSCTYDITLPGVAVMSYLMRSPLAGCGNLSSAPAALALPPPSGAAGGTPPPTSLIPSPPPSSSPAPLGVVVLPASVPLSLSVSDPSSFDAAAVAAAVAASMGLSPGAVTATSVSATTQFVLSYAGVASLPASAQSAIAEQLASQLSLPSAAYVTFADVAAPAGGRHLRQLAGATTVRAAGVPSSAFTALAAYGTAAITADLTTVLATAAPGLTLSAVSAPSYTMTMLLAIVAAAGNASPSAVASALAAAVTSGALAAALTSAGVAGATALGAGCAASPCFPGVTCTDVTASSSATAITADTYVCGACPVGSAGNGSTCVPCGALQPPTLQLSFASPVLRSAPLTFLATVATPTGAPDGSRCSLGAGFSYAWTLRDGAGAVATLPAESTTSMSLSLPSGALAPGAGASVALTVCYAAAPALPCGNSGTVSFEVVPSPLIVAISGQKNGQITAGNALALLDGSFSTDPDVPIGVTGSGMSYEWTCAAPGGGACTDASGATLGAVTTPVFTLLARLPGGPLPGVVYRLTLRIAKDTRAASAATNMTVIADGVARPTVAIDALPLPALNPSQRNVLRAAVAPATQGDTLVTTWSIAPSSNATVDLSSPAVSSTPVTFASFVLLPNALAGGSVYTFRLTAVSTSALTGNTSSSFSEIVVPTTASFPQPGSLSVTWPGGPGTPGVALSTRFTLTAAGWSAADVADLPLQFSFGYLPAGAAPDAQNVVLLTPFRPSATASAPLPGGALTLLAFAQSARGATVDFATALRVAATVTVAPAPSGTAGSAAEALFAVPLVAEALAAAAAGQADDALQLASGLAAEFNAAPSAAAPRLEWREQLLAAVTTAAAGAPPTPSQLQLTAGALAALTKTPSELSSGARALAITALTSVATSGASVSVPTAASVLFSLSNVSVSSVDAILAASSNASAGLSALRGVLGAVGGLSASLQAQLTVPGEAPVSLSAPNISAQVALDLTAPGTRLFASNTSAPGAGAAAFGPLPAGALPPGLTAVNTAFHFMSFDPHSGAVANGSGSARLLLSAPDGSGAPVTVGALAVPIQITLPPLPLSGSSGGAGLCTFWNSSRQVYSADGCVSLPTPLPVGVTARFNATLASLGAAGALELASSVLLDGTLTDGCSMAVLDCAARGDAAVYFLNPDDPFSAPAVRCPSLNAGSNPTGLGGSATGAAPPLRVYYGASCALWRADNAADCFWNVTAQAFAGGGCVPPGTPEQCLCRHVRTPPCLLLPRLLNTHSLTDLTLTFALPPLIHALIHS
jgi:hypothetical protein